MATSAINGSLARWFNRRVRVAFDVKNPLHLNAYRSFLKEGRWTHSDEPEHEILFQLECGYPSIPTMIASKLATQYMKETLNDETILDPFEEAYAASLNTAENYRIDSSVAKAIVMADIGVQPLNVVEPSDLDIPTYFRKGGEQLMPDAPKKFSVA